MNSKTYSIVATVLFALALIGVIFLWTRNSKLQTSNEEYMTEVDSLTQVKYDLLNDLDSLQLAYEGLAVTSDSLSNSLAGAKENIDRLERIRRQSASDLRSLREEINQLRAVKSELSANVAQLQEENAMLLAQNDSLNQELVVSQSRNQQLVSQTSQLEEANQALLDEMNTLKAESVKATGFRIDIEKDNGKPTLHGRRADVIEVSFDMTSVPREYQGLHTVYLVISDPNGTPIQSVNPVRTRINVRGEVAEFEAQLAKEVNLSESQRLSFKHEIQERRLDPGYYRAAIYSDMGFLGASGFQIR